MTDDQVRAMLREMWQRHRPRTLVRAATVASALERLSVGTLSADRRVEAYGEAHRLKGILGTYGFPEGSELAGEAEEALDPNAAAPPAVDLSARWAAYAGSLAAFDTPD